MYINLILGVLVIAAVVWLLALYNRKDESPREMLADEIARRRSAQETARQAAANLAALRDGKLLRVERDLEEMRRGLPGEGLPENALSWRRDGERLIVTLQAGAKHSSAHETAEEGGRRGAEELVIRWDVRNLDIDFLAGSEPPQNVSGDYSLAIGDGKVACEEEHAAFMRVVSGLIADRLA